MATFAAILDSGGRKISGSKTFTKNGQYDVTWIESAEVDVYVPQLNRPTLELGTASGTTYLRVPKESNADGNHANVYLLYCDGAEVANFYGAGNSGMDDDSGGYWFSDKSWWTKLSAGTHILQVIAINAKEPVWTYGTRRSGYFRDSPLSNMIYYTKS